MKFKKSNKLVGAYERTQGFGEDARVTVIIAKQTFGGWKIIVSKETYDYFDKEWEGRSYDTVVKGLRTKKQAIEYATTMELFHW